MVGTNPKPKGPRPPNPQLINHPPIPPALPLEVFDRCEVCRFHFRAPDAKRHVCRVCVGRIYATALTIRRRRRAWRRFLNWLQGEPQSVGALTPVAISARLRLRPPIPRLLGPPPKSGTAMRRCTPSDHSGPITVCLPRGYFPALLRNRTFPDMATAKAATPGGMGEGEIPDV